MNYVVTKNKNKISLEGSAKSIGKFLDESRRNKSFIYTLRILMYVRIGGRGNAKIKKRLAWPGDKGAVSS